MGRFMPDLIVCHCFVGMIWLTSCSGSSCISSMLPAADSSVFFPPLVSIQAHEVNLNGFELLLPLNITLWGNRSVSLTKEMVNTTMTVMTLLADMTCSGNGALKTFQTYWLTDTFYVKAALIRIFIVTGESQCYHQTALPHSLWTVWFLFKFTVCLLLLWQTTWQQLSSGVSVEKAQYKAGLDSPDLCHPALNNHFMRWQFCVQTVRQDVFHKPVCAPLTVTNI